MGRASYSRGVGAIALGAVVALLAAALTYGVRIGAFGWLPGFRASSALDYSSGLRQDYAPLSNAFIEKVLGHVIASGPRSAETGERLSSPANVGPFDAPRTEVVHPLTNDTESSAKTVPAVPFTARTNTQGSHRETDEPSDCGSLGDTVWYRFTPSRDVGLYAYTFGTKSPVALGVFESGNVVGCDGSTTGNALVAFPAKRNKTYYFQVAMTAQDGDVVFNLDPIGQTKPVSPDNTGDPNDPRDRLLPKPYTASPSLSSDGRVIAFASSDPSFSLPQVPCPTNPPEASSASIYYRGFYTAFGGTVLRPGALLPCIQVIVEDLRTGRARVASVNAKGEPANAHVLEFMLSGNGRYLAFTTYANNLVSNDDNALRDVFVRDLVLNTTERVSLTSEGKQLNRGLDDPVSSTDASVPSISDDGRYVFFESSNSDLAKDKPRANYVDQMVDVFVRDRVRNTTTRVSLSSTGEPALGDGIGGTLHAEGQERWKSLDARNAFPCISPSGRFVVFRSRAANFDPRANGTNPELFIRDLLTKRTELVSVSNAGVAANSANTYPALGRRAQPYAVRTCVSSDGRYVAFESNATNLALNNGAMDVYVRDRLQRRTIWASESGYSAENNGITLPPQNVIDACEVERALEAETNAPHEVCWRGGGSAAALSSDGRYVAFQSFDAVTAGDHNGSMDVYLYDLRTETTTWISVDPTGESLRPGSQLQQTAHSLPKYQSDLTGNISCEEPVITPNGDEVAFQCDPQQDLESVEEFGIFVHFRRNLG